MADDQNNLPLNSGNSGDGNSPAGTSIIPINIEDEMRRSYLDYSMSVIIGRALPDVRDGLKPVHRRILYTMSEMGLTANKKYTKSAKIVGQAMGQYHPHGDSAIYDALVRLAQPFSMRYPMVDGQGNFGSVDGDPPAAMRYTESRMTKIAGEMLADIDMDTVDFTPNYDESVLEPTVLPTRVPNLIINGAEGIAVGMATKIPPHNLTEVVNAAIDMVNNPSIGVKEVLRHVQGPDFPTGGILYGKSGIEKAYSTGRGRFLVRAKVATEAISGGRQSIVVTELPFQVNKSNLIKRIAELVNDKVIDEISGVDDFSDREGMRIVIELKRGAQPEIVLNQLFKHTQMQESFSMIFLAVHNGQPRELPLPDAIRAFIDHRIDVVRRRTAFLLGKARDREHILLGYQIALDHLDQVIRTIRNSSSRADARENLFRYFSGRAISLNGTEVAGITLDPAKYGITAETLPANGSLILSYRQIDAILDLQLYRLTQLSIDELLKELGEVRSNIAEYESILASDKKLRKLIVKELEEVRDKYGNERRTQIVDEGAELTLEDLIADEQVAVTVSNTGYLKRTPISTYRQQRRGGTGRLGMKTREEDFVAQLIVESTHSYLLCFTNTGRVFWVKIYEIPDVGATGKGKHIANLLALQPGEKVVTYLGIRDLTEEGKFIFFATQQGTVKKTPLTDFSNVMTRGIIAIGIGKDDELVGTRVTDGNQVIFLATREGMAIRFPESDVRSMGRPAAGVKGITLKKDDYVIALATTPSEEARQKRAAEGVAITPCLILSVSENGFGKRTDAEEYRLQTRGGSGVINMKATAKTGKVSSINLVDETSELMAISQFGKMIRI
ncbi:MAG: DNA gyrase subunit A, partial [Acidobacteria bacterium]|nr:DNA gyrase subunit A [Acidobacteriota bacterium]